MSKSSFYVTTTQAGTALTVQLMAVAGTNVESADLTLAGLAGSETFTGSTVPAGWVVSNNLTGGTVALFDAAGMPAGGAVDSVLATLTFTLATPTTVPAGTLTVSDYSDLGSKAYPASKAMPISGTSACFLAGTSILTDRGAIAVEDLAIGDNVALAGGGCRPIRWLGHRRMNAIDPTDLPIRVRAHAFAPNQPARDLYLSPEHAIFAGDALIPARALIDGCAVTQVSMDDVVYHHILLDQHAIILAEGLPCESLLDCEADVAFDNGATAPENFVFLSPVAPRLTQGEAVERVRHLLRNSRSLAG